ncbi:hypothetical protein JNW90_29315 [Micromonospora sp. STR1s_5]|nr:hypothetical protein [Micromonospora sp. STR1s_5]
MDAAELPPVVTLRVMAEDLGLPYETVLTYRKRSIRNRRNAQPRPGDLPVPDAPLDDKPGWTRETYLTWKANRPGRGAGGGRPWPQAGENEPECGVTIDHDAPPGYPACRRCGVELE